MRREKFVLISVYDKRGVDKIAKFLEGKGYKIISTGGTEKYLNEKGISTINVSKITEFPEIFSGRVKTLHPKIFGGILFRRETEDEIDAEELDIPEIDVVIVNLYPFEESLKRRFSQDEMIEMIDIGGPSLIRASAKNYRFITVLTSPDDYELFINSYIENGHIPEPLREEFARKAFRITSYYDYLISSYFGGFKPKDDVFVTGGRKVKTLRYGENPHQWGGVFSEFPDSWIETLEQLNGKELSYNNLKDVYEALSIGNEFSDNFSAILKHNNPCGAGEGKDLKEAYKKALSGDPKSAFGGIVVLNGVVEKELAEEIRKIFFEVIIADDYTEDALSILKKKKNLRLLRVKNFKRKPFKFSYIEGGILVQESDDLVFEKDKLRLVCGEKPSPDIIDEIIFSFKIVKHLKSNAISITKDKTLLGYGTGFTSRVDAVEFAIKKAKEFNRNLEGAVLSSDAFFPFPDSIEIAAKEGIEYIVQPGGSIRDEEVIERCKELGITMFFTGIRHFKH